jgi:hypothetical protein
MEIKKKLFIKNLFYYRKMNAILIAYHLDSLLFI